ncbi:MAG: leucine-rich repeat domain-containing protein [Paraprevotella sp.]|nr:leucine-rich repeat domain-containing protein [Paraprevotella sp.]
MKEIKKRAFALITLLLCLHLAAVAQEFTFTYERQTLKYNVLDEEAKTCEVASEQSQSISGDVIIPAEANGYTVIAIGSRAFENCNGLKSVNIPNSVTSIGDQAFSYCSGLTSVDIPNSVTKIGYYAFLDCRGLTSINISNSVTSIGDFAFSDCFGLTSINIPNSVTVIGDGAFSWCSGLTSINIPNSVTTIGDGAFKYCPKLQEIMILSSSLKKLRGFGYGNNLQYIYAHKPMIDKWGGDIHSWHSNVQLIELAPIGTIAYALEKTDTELSFRLKPTADDGSVVQMLYYEGKPIEADETGTYRLTGLYPYVDIALSADVLRDGVLERAGFYLYAHSEVQPVELHITEAGFATLMLPYDAPLPEGVEAYATSQAKEATANGNRTLILETSDWLQANTPYIIKGQPGTYRFSGIATNEGDTYTAGWLTGTFAPVQAVAGTYVLQNNGGVTGFYRVAAGKEPYVGAYRAWLSVPDGESSAAEVTAFVFSDNAATGIEGATADRRVDVYTQEGVKVRSNVRMADALKELPRGIYVVDGAKKAVR